MCVYKLRSITGIFIFLTLGEDFGNVMNHATFSTPVVRPFLLVMNVVGVLLLNALLVASFQRAYLAELERLHRREHADARVRARSGLLLVYLHLGLSLPDQRAKLEAAMRTGRCVPACCLLLLLVLLRLLLPCCFRCRCCYFGVVVVVVGGGGGGGGGGGVLLRREGWRRCEAARSRLVALTCVHCPLPCCQRRGSREQPAVCRQGSAAARAVRR
jgi:hypothetical protein